MYANHKGRKGFIDLCSIFVSLLLFFTRWQNYLGNRVYDIITSRGKINESRFAEKEGIFLNHEGAFGNQEGMIT